MEQSNLRIHAYTLTRIFRIVKCTRRWHFLSLQCHRLRGPLVGGTATQVIATSAAKAT
jgi:hypothetical protein